MKLINVIKFSFFTLISRVLGLIRDIIISRYLGAGVLSDAFFVAFKVPNLFRKLFAEGSMQAVFIPIFNSLLHKDVKAAKNFAKAIFAILLISLLILLIILEIYTKQWVSFISPGFKNKDINVFNLTVLLVRITLPYLLFISLATFYASILNSLNKFSLSAFLPALLNIAIIICLIVGVGNYAVIASIGVVLGGLVQLLVVLYWCKKFNWLVFSLKWNFKSAEVKLFFKRLFPVVFGAGVYQVNIVLDIIFASLLSFGTISYLFYADRIYQLPLSLIGIAIGSVLLPSLAKNILLKDQLNNNINNAIQLGLVFSLIATVGLVVFNYNIIYMVYFGGNFNVVDVQITSVMLIIYAVSLPFNVIIKIILPVFYSHGNIKTPLYSTIISLLINVGVLWWLVIINNNVYGVAYGTMIASLINFFILWLNLRIKYSFYLSKPFKTELLKIIFITIIITIICLILQNTLNFINNLNLLRFIMCVIIVLVFVVLIFLLKIFNTNTYKQIISIFNKKVN